MDNKRLIIIVILFCLVILSLVGTYAYFTSMVSSDEEALSASTAKFNLSLDVRGVYVYNKLIPMDDNLAITGFNHQCVDNNEFNVCQVYSITLENDSGTGQDERLLGFINFNITKIKNLSYLLIEEDETIYKDVTSITNGENLSLGDYVQLKDGESKKFYLIVWLSNKNKDQGLDDANGSFNASVTYTSVRGDNLSSMITGTIN